MSKVHCIAASGFGTGTNELYDRIRPSYQPFVISCLSDAVKGYSSINIVEIGSGTGIFTRALLTNSELNAKIKEIRAVEPSEGMRNMFSETVKDARVSLSEGTFDDTGVPEGWADLVVIAQAFHWCPNYDSAFAEFSRILNSTGIVALVWNLEDRDGAKWVSQLRDLIEQHEKGTPQFRLNLWRACFDSTSYEKFFKEPKEQTWSYHLQGKEEIVIDRACSKSYIAVLSAEEKNSLRKKVKDILKKGDDKIWIDESKGVFEYPYKTWLIIAERK